MTNGGLLHAFMALRPALLRYLSLRGASADEAEDVVQEVGLKLAGEHPGPVAQPSAYLYRMTHNHFLLHRRTASRRSKREEAWFGINTGDPPEMDETPLAEARLVAREQLMVLQRVIDGLPDRTRAIFRRFRIDNVPQRQIAGEFQISVSAVEKHLARAYQAIATERHSLDEGVAPSRSLLQGERDRHGY